MATSEKLRFRYKSDQILRATVFVRDDFTCLECGWRPSEIPLDYNGKYTVIGNKENEMTWLEVDHILPRHLGGTNDIDNLQTLCKSCNCSKGGRGVG